VKLLSEALMTELEANQSILLHGGPQSSRRAVLLLNKLGKAHQVFEKIITNQFIYWQLCVQMTHSKSGKITLNSM
jgi:hypothetical protein